MRRGHRAPPARGEAHGHALCRVQGRPGKEGNAQRIRPRAQEPGSGLLAQVRLRTLKAHLMAAQCGRFEACFGACLGGSFFAGCAGSEAGKVAKTVCMSAISGARTSVEVPPESAPWSSSIETIGGRSSSQGKLLTSGLMPLMFFT